jgi:hypothetical protein
MFERLRAERLIVLRCHVSCSPASKSAEFHRVGSDKHQLRHFGGLGKSQDRTNCDADQNDYGGVDKPSTDKEIVELIGHLFWSR